MRTQLPTCLILLLSFASFAWAAAEGKNCGCDCCKGEKVCCCSSEETASQATKGDGPRHPLRGVIVAIQAEDSTLTVKHEAIPGVMPAMTMVFKVEGSTAKTAKKGQTITAHMSRKGEDWWLHEVKPVTKET